jgi:hypothetical protein
VLSLAPGAHEVRLEHPDFEQQTRQVLLEPGVRDSLVLSLWETMGTLVVLVSPWAEVEIDGEAHGEVPRADPFLLTPGEHRVTLRNPTLGAERDTLVSVRAGRSTTIRMSLDEAR